MSDSIDLEALKVRKAERGRWRDDVPQPITPAVGRSSSSATFREWWEQAEADLSRAIAIAEDAKMGERLEIRLREQHQRDLAQARQDVLLLRDALTGNVRHDPALGATAHYEQHRQTQEWEAREYVPGQRVEARPDQGRIMPEHLTTQEGD